MVELGNQLPRQYLLVGDHLVATQYWRRRDIIRVEPLQPIRRRALLDDLRHQQNPLGGVDRPATGRVEPRILAEIRSFRGGAKAPPLGIGDGTDGDVAVRSREDQLGARRGVGGACLPSDHRVLRHRFRPEIGDHRVEHRQPDVLPQAGPLAGKECGGHRLSGKDRRGLVGDDRADHARSAGLGVRLDVGEARQALDDRVVDALARIRPAFADAADRDIDQARMEGAQCWLAEAEALHRAGPEVLYQHVGACDQLAHDLCSLRPLEVERQRPLAPVRGDEQGREFPRGAYRLPAVAGNVATERLDLDHLRALVGEEHG